MQHDSVSTVPMNRCRSRRWFFAALTAVAAFSFCVLSIADAQASCGDYLSHGGYPGLGFTPHGAPTGKHQSRMPCHGPMCHQGPIHLPLSPPVVNLESQDRWNWLAGMEFQPIRQISWMAQSDESYLPLLVAFRLDRPPKVESV